jgi:hypothetical protein
LPIWPVRTTLAGYAVGFLGPARNSADERHRIFSPGSGTPTIPHEAITDPDDLADVTRALWTVEVPDGDLRGVATPELPPAVLTGGIDTYPPCREEAGRLRANGAAALLAPSAALTARAAAPEWTDGGLCAGLPVDGRILVLFGSRPDLDGWRVVDGGA